MKNQKTKKSAIILALICTLFVAVGQILFKLGSAKIVDILSFFNLSVVGGALAYLLGSILFILALKKGELSVIVPLIALNFVWVGLLSKIYLGEEINLTRWVGIVTIMAGVVFIGKGGRHGD